MRDVETVLWLKKLVCRTRSMQGTCCYIDNRLLVVLPVIVYNIMLSILNMWVTLKHSFTVFAVFLALNWNFYGCFQIGSSLTACLWSVGLDQQNWWKRFQVCFCILLKQSSLVAKLYYLEDLGMYLHLLIHIFSSFQLFFSSRTLTP